MDHENASRKVSRSWHGLSKMAWPGRVGLGLRGEVCLGYGGALNASGFKLPAVPWVEQRRRPGWPRSMQAWRPVALMLGGARPGYAGRVCLDAVCALIRDGGGVVAAMCPAGSPGCPSGAQSGQGAVHRSWRDEPAITLKSRAALERSGTQPRPRGAGLLDRRQPPQTGPCTARLFPGKLWPGAVATPLQIYEWDGEDAGQQERAGHPRPPLRDISRVAADGSPELIAFELGEIR